MELPGGKIAGMYHAPTESMNEYLDTQRMASKPSSRTVFRIGVFTLVAWTLAAILVSLWLSGADGHPSGMALVPLVAFAWLLGAAMMWVVTYVMAHKLKNPPGPPKP